MLAIGRGITTGLSGTITIAFMTLFMLLEGPAWMKRLFALVSARSQARWRSASPPARCRFGFATG